MGKTKIEWTEMSWNPVTGCTKISPGCAHCYAERMARRLAGRAGYPKAPHHFDVTLHPNRLEQPLHWRKPRMIFVPSMGDLFHEDVPFDFIGEVFATIIAADQHTFQILTKRIERTQQFITWFFARTSLRSFRHIWLGVSVENSDYLWRVEWLLKCSAAVRFVSLEPLLEPIVGLKEYLYQVYIDRNQPILRETRPPLDWVIVGGESGPGARPMHPDWVRGIRNQCAMAGVPFFFKQWGAWLHQSQTTAQQRSQMHNKLKSLPSHKWPDGSYSWRVGKKYAGHLLDGQKWNEIPQ